MRVAAGACLLVLVLWAPTASAVERAAVYAEKGGADLRLGIEFMRHNRSRFIIEGKLVLPFFTLEHASRSIYSPAGVLTLQLLW